MKKIWITIMFICVATLNWNAMLTTSYAGQCGNNNQGGSNEPPSDNGMDDSESDSNDPSKPEDSRSSDSGGVGAMLFHAAGDGGGNTSGGSRPIGGMSVNPNNHGGSTFGWGGASTGNTSGGSRPIGGMSVNPNNHGGSTFGWSGGSTGNTSGGSRPIGGMSVNPNNHGGSSLGWGSGNTRNTSGGSRPIGGMSVNPNDHGGSSLGWGNGNGNNGGGYNKFSTFTGNVHREITDLEIWGGVGEHQLEWKRYGNSRFDYTGQRFFGWAHNWRHSYQWQMADAGINGSGQLQLDVFYPNGTQHRFAKISSTEWRSTPKVKDIIYQNGSTFTLQRANGWQYHFKILNGGQGNTFYQLQSFQDSQQSTYTLSYEPGPNGFPELVQITEPAGRYLRISYENKPYFTDQTVTAAQITQTPLADEWNEILINNPNAYRFIFYVGSIGSDCAVAEIEFYEAGTDLKLSGVPIGTSPAKSPGNEYDKAFDGNPNTWFEFSNRYYGYTGLDLGSAKHIGRIRFRAAPGLSTTMIGGVFRASNLVPASDRVISQVETSDGRSVVYTYENYPDSVLPMDYIGIQSASYGDGTAATYNYEASISGTVPLLTFASDTRCVGPASAMKYQYHTTNIGVVGFVHQELNGVNNTVMATLTGDGNETMFVEYTNGGIETYHFPEVQGGRLDNRINGLGYPKTFTYDQNGMGYLIAETDTNGQTTQYERNTQGKLTGVTRSDGAQKTWTRDNLNLVLTETNELGYTTTYTRDSQHRITRIDYPDKSYETFIYNAFNQITQHRLRNGGIESANYDANGLKISSTDPLGYITTYTYDSADRLASITDPNGHTTQYQYNDRGLITLITYEDGSIRQFTYDVLGNKTSETNELGKTWEFTYDEFSRLTTSTDPLKRTTQYHYGIGLGGCSSCHIEANPTEILLPSGKQTTFTYDVLWQKTSETVGDNTPGAATTQYQYDPIGNLTVIIEPSGQSWQYIYNARNWRTDAIDPLGRQTTWAYDAVGNLQSLTRPDGSLIKYEYNAMNRLIATTDALSQTISFEYDLGGNLITRIDPKGNTYCYTYDLMNRQLSLQYPDLSQESFEYDAVSNRITITTRAGQVMSCTFDNRNREIHCDWSDATPDITKTYDLAGRLLTLDNGVSQIHYVYDEANQLISERQFIAGYPSVFEISHDYDGDGNPGKLVYPAGANIHYAYNGRNQIAEIILNQQSLASYQYNLNGERTQKFLDNGIITEYEHDAASQLTKVIHQNATGVFGGSTYTYDLNDNCTEQTFSNSTVETYTYDATNQLTNAVYDNQAIGQPNRNVAYSYDSVGNRLQVNDTGNIILSSPNALNQYTVVAGGALTYDGNGNLTSYKGWTYTYDAQNRITSAQKLGTQVNFAYDVRNRCIRRTINGIATYLCYAGWNLIEEHDSSGSLIASYVHGANTDEILVQIDASGANRLFHHQDALGNITHLTNESGNLLEQYRYDVFGRPTFLNAQNTILASSAYGNRFLFTGREWIQEAQLYDYRNRIYSAELGRFLQTDPIRFEAGDENLYRYVFNSPINRAIQ